MRPGRTPITVAAAGGAVLGTLLLFTGLDWEPLRRIDEGLASRAVTGFGDPDLMQAADHVTHLADAHRFFVLSVGVVALGLTLSRFREAFSAAILLGGASVTTQLLQATVPQPEPHVLTGGLVVDQPFPSGHATSAASLALALTLVLPSRFRPVGWALGCVFVVAQWLALMIVHTHMPSHLVGGLFVAVAWAGLVAVCLQAADGRWQRRGRSLAGRQRRTLVGVRALLAVGVVAATAAAVVVPDSDDARDLFTTRAEVAVPAALIAGAGTVALAITFYAASWAFTRKRGSASPG